MTIEEAIRAYLLSLSAVSAITSIIRPDELSQADKPPAIIISVNSEDMNNNVDGTCDMVTASIVISAISSNKTQARTLSQAIRTNGTNPGTGMAGCSVKTGGLPFDAMLENRASGYILNEDGKDSGLYSVDSTYTVMYYETT